MNKPTAFSIPPEMVEKIDEYREGKDLSRSYVVRRALDRYFGEEVNNNVESKNEESRDRK